MTLALVFVECAKDLASSAEHAVNQIQGVLETHSVKGNSSYDLVVKVQTADESELKNTINTLKSVAGIVAVATCIVYGSMQ